MRQILLGDNLEILEDLPSSFARLVYIDPPFNTGRVQSRDRFKATRSEEGRLGFGDHRYQVDSIPSPSFADSFDDYLEYLLLRIRAAVRCMTPDGSLFVHLDAREVHYVKVELDKLFGRDNFMNEIIWAYDYGGRSRTRWPAKHDNILWYVLDRKNYVFNYDAMDRIPYLAPDLVGPIKAARGKTPTDCWTLTIVPTNSKEKTGYPTQKPLTVLRRIIKVHSNPGDTVLDLFGGSGTTGMAAAENGRDFVLVDSNPAAVEIMNRRLQPFLP